MTTTTSKVKAETASVLETLATNIRTRRAGKGWTRRRLATETGLHVDVLQKIEMQQRLPTVETVCIIATALGIPARTLLEP